MIVLHGLKFSTYSLMWVFYGDKELQTQTKHKYEPLDATIRFLYLYELKFLPIGC